MRRWKTGVAALLLAVAATASEGPVEVARSFWNAVKAGDLESAKALTVRGHVSLDLPVKVVLDNVVLAEANASDGYAEVPTAVTFRLKMEDLESADCNATFETDLLEVGGRWKIDDLMTMRNYEKGLREGALVCGSRLMEEWLQMSLGTLEKYKEPLKKNGEQMGETMRKMMEELEKAMEKALRDFELQEPPAKPQLPPPHKGETI